MPGRAMATQGSADARLFDPVYRVASNNAATRCRCIGLRVGMEATKSRRMWYFGLDDVVVVVTAVTDFGRSHFAVDVRNVVLSWARAER